MFARPRNVSRTMSTRSAIEKSGDFSAFTRIATMIFSKRCVPRSMISTWPLVNGSNDPGKTASLDFMVSPVTRVAPIHRRFRIEREGAVPRVQRAHARERSGELGRGAAPGVFQHGQAA